MGAARGDVDHVEVQRRRFVGKVDELTRTRVRRRIGKEIDERHRRDDAAPTRRARRYRRPLEVARERQQRSRLGGVERHLLTVVVEEEEVRIGHSPDGSPAPRGPGRPRRRRVPGRPENHSVRTDTT
jgi:hypothetical protein